MKGGKKKMSQKKKITNEPKMLPGEPITIFACDGQCRGKENHILNKTEETLQIRLKAS